MMIISWTLFLAIIFFILGQNAYSWEQDWELKDFGAGYKVSALSLYSPNREIEEKGVTGSFDLYFQSNRFGFVGLSQDMAINPLGITTVYGGIEFAFFSGAILFELKGGAGLLNNKKSLEDQGDIQRVRLVDLYLAPALNIKIYNNYYLNLEASYYDIDGYENDIPAGGDISSYIIGIKYKFD